MMRSCNTFRVFIQFAVAHCPSASRSVSLPLTINHQWVRPDTLLVLNFRLMLNLFPSVECFLREELIEVVVAVLKVPQILLVP